MDLKEELEELKRIKDGSAALEQRKKETEEALKAKMEEFKKRIQQGDTTGNLVKDFCILHYCFSPMLVELAEKNCHQLIERTKGHSGEFVLLVVRNKVDSEGDIFMGLGSVIEEELYLGVLENDEFVVDPIQKRCGFPTKKYVESETPASWGLRREPKIEEGLLQTFQVFGDVLTGLDFPPELVGRLGESLQRIEVKIGDEEVRAWFKEQAGCCDSPGGGYFVFHGNYLLLFQKMAQLLGRPITESPALDAELEEQVRKKIRLITELAKKEKEAREYEENAAKRLTPDFTTARETHQKIVEELRDAIEVGLTRNPAIRELCREYKVDLPKEKEVPS